MIIERKRCPHCRLFAEFCIPGEHDDWRDAVDAEWNGVSPTIILTCPLCGGQSVVAEDPLARPDSADDTFYWVLEVAPDEILRSVPSGSNEVDPDPNVR